MEQPALLTFEKDFDDAHQRLMQMGAGERAVAGTVTIGQTTYPAIYRATIEPPAITQILPSGHDRMTASITRLSPPENRLPIVEVGRFTYDLPVESNDIYEAVINTDQMRLARTFTANAMAVLCFDHAYEGIMNFTPDSVAQD